MKIIRTLDNFPHLLKNEKKMAPKYCTCDAIKIFFFSSHKLLDRINHYLIFFCENLYFSKNANRLRVNLTALSDDRREKKSNTLLKMLTNFCFKVIYLHAHFIASNIISVDWIFSSDW